jgi:hypothetical protein
MATENEEHGIKHQEIQRTKSPPSESQALPMPVRLYILRVVLYMYTSIIRRKREYKDPDMYIAYTSYTTTFRLQDNKPSEVVFRPQLTCRPGKLHSVEAR